jgi:hypothetical protein
MDVLGYGLAGGTMAHLTSGVRLLHFMNHDKDRTHALDQLQRSPVAFFMQHNRSRCILMKKIRTPLLCLFSVINVWAMLYSPKPISGQPSMANGIQPLIQLEGQPLHQLIPPNIRPLLLSQEQEQFLQELEGLPPDWRRLQDLDHTVQSERLFQLNRERDEARLVRQNLLQQPIGFLWAGVLRQYLPEYRGFSVALGPERTSTSWGIVRFKPMGLPDYLVAIPSRESARELLVQQQNGKQIDIGVLFIGTLVTDESLIYDFSHDGKKEGMVLPVVLIQDVRYFLKNS